MLPEGSVKPMLAHIRLRVLAIVVGVVLAVVGVVSFAAWPIVPVLGVAIITVAAAVNSATARLAAPVCTTCGEKLPGATEGDRVLKSGPYGVVCEACGALNDPSRPADHRVA